ncbi:MAG: bifunctional 5,10-methylenetetrahydrofolate dehydrogenase/5,10-methenyltetrahydrofolate cyclohydrolase [Euryarchaeota archaeon]|nr:bifunctional 5,10-methylenetetrahydrofolate dehydrogenase/5,10-methenyltetrahydrofolate cyclohydrolase [Euryarchaeota archaeon]
MPARILDGRALAKERNAETARAIQERLSLAGRPPRLDVVLVGADAASAVYVRNKERAGKKVGIEGRVHDVSADITQEALAERLRALQADDALDGLILQLPLPGGLDPYPLLALIDPARDVDGFHPENTGKLLSGVPGGFAPATPLGILWILLEAGIRLQGAEVVVVSHSNLIGKPLAAMLMNHDATVTVCHVHTRDLAAHTSRADVVVTAAGVPGLITKDHIAEGALVVDAATVLGDDGVLRGDCAPDVAEKAGTLTPVPGGVGPVTVSALLHNTRLAWERRTG